ncbi:MAG: hypothetical protein HFJ48_06005 [Clostridia bacterium]|nr:hypothetical protein [Clostridia bacterium]
MKEKTKNWGILAIIFIILIVVTIIAVKDTKQTSTQIYNNYNVSNINTADILKNNINYNFNKDEGKKHLVVSNGYRFKNSIDEVTLYFEEIYIISEWKEIKPHNDYFLIMKATATSNTPSDSLYNFPFVILDSNKKEYLSINDTFNYDYKDLKGNDVDPATEINLKYVKKTEGKIRAYNTDFVAGGKRNKIFSI